MSRYSVSMTAGQRTSHVFGYTIDPPFTADRDGRYLALINPDTNTARLQYVGPEPEPMRLDEDENRWAAFTDDELESLDYELGERARNPLLGEIVAELERRRS